MQTSPASAGTAVGRALGSTAAHTGHFVVSALTATGRFGQDVASGASAGYAETAALRLAQRQERAAARKAAGQPETPIGVILTA